MSMLPTATVCLTDAFLNVSGQQIMLSWTEKQHISNFGLQEVLACGINCQFYEMCCPYAKRVNFPALS